MSELTADETDALIEQVLGMTSNLKEEMHKTALKEVGANDFVLLYHVNVWGRTFVFQWNATFVTNQKNIGFKASTSNFRCICT